MKAIRAHAFGGPEVLQLDDVVDPTPGPAEVVIDVKAAGVNPADTYMRGGAYAIVPDLPYTPGGDAASPNSDNAVTDLPDPDSPISPRHSPGLMSKLTPPTAL